MAQSVGSFEFLNSIEFFFREKLGQNSWGKALVCKRTGFEILGQVSVGHKNFSGAKTKGKAKDEAGRKTLYVISNQIRPGSTVKALRTYKRPLGLRALNVHRSV
jgi:hypothetical protein